MKTAQSTRVDIALITLDANGIITKWSAGAESLYGHSSPEALGQNIYRVLNLHEAASSNFELELAAAYREGNAEFGHRFHRKDGTHFDGRGLVKPVWHRGNFLGYDLTLFPQAGCSVVKSYLPRQHNNQPQCNGNKRQSDEQTAEGTASIAK